MALLYMSFADEEGFRGGVFLDVVAELASIPPADLMWAVRETARLGINPGGEVASIYVPVDKVAGIPSDKIGVLLTKEQILSL